MSFASTTEHSFLLQMAREGAAARKADGIVDPERDAVLARFEAGDFRFRRQDGTMEGLTPAATVKADSDLKPQSNPTGKNHSNDRAVRMATANQVRALHNMARAGRKLGVDAELCERAEQVSEEITSFSTASALMDQLGGKLDAARDSATKADGFVQRGTVLSPKQVDLIMTMGAERGQHFERGAVEQMSVEEFRHTFAELKRTARTNEVPREQPRPASTETVGEGVYLLDGEYYRVLRAVHGSGNLYAKVFDPETQRFEYARGAMRKLRPEHKVTEEQAKAFGAAYGRCVRCAKVLTKDESKERMMGDVCAGKMGF